MDNVDTALGHQFAYLVVNTSESKVGTCVLWVDLD